MTQIINLLHSDPHGNPWTAGRNYHLVRMSDAPMTVIAQLHDGGNYPNMDCAVADTISLLYDLLHISVGGLTIEGDEHTGPNGTGLQGIVDGLALFGIGAEIVNGTPPAGLAVMNPAWGGIISAATAAPYYAASTGNYVLIHEPHGKETDDMRIEAFDWDAKNQQHSFQITTDGHFFHKWWDAVTGDNSQEMVDPINHQPGGFAPDAGVIWKYRPGQLRVYVEHAGFVCCYWQGDAEGVWHSRRLK
jgi:hypothetical protein